MSSKTLGSVAVITAALIAFFAAGIQSRAQFGNQPPILVQAANVVTDASGNWTVTWTSNFNSPTPFIAPLAVQPAGNNPINCATVSRTNNTATGWCRQSTPTLLTLAIVTTGLTLNPFQNIPSTGTTVMVVGRDTTQ